MSVYSRSVNCADSGTAVLLEPNDSVPLWPPQISNGLAWDWTGASAARGRRLTYQLAQSACHYTECMDIPHPSTCSFSLTLYPAVYFPVFSCTNAAMLFTEEWASCDSIRYRQAFWAGCYMPADLEGYTPADSQWETSGVASLTIHGTSFSGLSVITLCKAVWHFFLIVSLLKLNTELIYVTNKARRWNT